MTNQDAIKTFVNRLRMPSRKSCFSGHKAKGPFCTLLKHVKNTVSHAPAAAFPFYTTSRRQSVQL